MNHTDRMAFTGDALLIRACGRTDFQEGRSVINSNLFYIDLHFVTCREDQGSGRECIAKECK